VPGAPVQNMRFLLILGLVFFVVLYFIGAVLIAWTWWLSGRSLTQPPDDSKSSGAVPEAPRTRAA
jgi:hypothetical protein